MAGIWQRLLPRLIRQEGWRNTLTGLWKNATLQFPLPSRLVRHDHRPWILPDLPPMDSSVFLECLERELSGSIRQMPVMPVTAILSVTASCPHSCPYCYVAPVPEGFAGLSVEELVQAVEELSRAQVRTFHFSGGEPALRWQDLVQVMNTCAASDRFFWMLTTGHGLCADSLEKLARAGLTGIMVSLDSFDPEAIRRIKGDPAVLETAVNVLVQARSAGLLTAINAVTSRSLLHKESFFRFIRRAGELGVSFVNFYAPRRIRKDLPGEIAPFGVDEYLQLHSLARRCNASRKPWPLAYTPDVWEAVRGCQGGRSFVYVDPQGQLCRCPFLKKQYGDVRQGNLAQVIRRMQQDPEAEVCEGNRLLTAGLKNRNG